MVTNLVNSDIDRQNILNNKYAISVIQDSIGISGILFEDQYILTRKQVADFYEIDDKTIDRYLEKNESELRKNGYEILAGERLNKAKNILGTDINVGTKTTRVGVFNFRAFLNIGMLLQESEKARQLRSIILDIAIDTVNQKAGGHTKYINQREESFIISAFEEENYRKKFTDALDDYLEMGPIKYAIYTNRIYQIAFKEDAMEYKKILGLSKKENPRDTFYSEVLDVIASLENGIADELKKQSDSKKRKLTSTEVDYIFSHVEENPFLKPFIDRSRQLMSSRDLCFRDALHENLKEYIGDVSESDFERFLGEKSKSLQEQIEESQDIFKRLKDR